MTTAQTLHSHAPAAATRMAAAAGKFLDCLSPAQRESATFPFDGDERYIWNYTPVPRNGLLLREMDDSQREVALELMATGLSERGNATALQIISLEKDLGEWESMTDSLSQWERNSEIYWFSVFGNPGSTDEPWGWRVGGHHVCLHYTVVNGDLVTPNPLFFGANPATVQHGERKGLRTLADEEDLARALVKGLDADLKDAAVVDPIAPADILTKSYRSADPGATPVGLAYSRMGADSREQLVKLMKLYIERSSGDLAGNVWAKIEEAGLGDITFAWAGPEDPGYGHYYAVKNANFLIEYDNTQNGANHVHSVFRDYENDFGEDLLAAHYSTASHHA